MKSTAIDDVILAIVTSIDAGTTYPVFDGPPSKRPAHSVDRWLVIGASEADNQDEATESARMTATITGLGQVARTEELEIDCVAVGRVMPGTIAEARTAAKAMVEEASQHLAKCPTADTYGAHVSGISAVRSHNITGGAIVQIQFTISASARLT